MAQLHVFGVQKLDFTAQDGNQIQGITLHAFREPTSQYYQGKQYEKVFVGSKSDNYPFVESLKAPVDLEVFYNSRGKVESLSVIK